MRIETVCIVALAALAGPLARARAGQEVPPAGGQGAPPVETPPGAEVPSGDGSAAAAQGSATWRVALRVTRSESRHVVVVDRGARDGLEAGDPVVFEPRTGGAFEGFVRTVEAQRATVELPAGTPELPPGTRGVARFPKGRLGAAARGEEPEAPPPAAPGAQVEPERPDARSPGSFDLADDGWTPDMPLLAGGSAVRPRDRERRIGGRAWSSFDAIFGADGDRSDTFWRAGAEVVVTNPFGRGGELVLDGELVGRETMRPDDANLGDEDDKAFLLRRFSYEIGGTRFEERRMTFGRFLLRELPEIGVVDGVEWSRRMDDGQRFGFTAGFLPEPDGSLDGTSDIGFSAWYRWVRDDSEETALTTAFHKTFHDGDSDRDLVVLKAQHLPASGWSLLGTAWVDLHAGDEVDEGLKLTEAHASAGRRWSGDYDLRLTYDHREYPELLRDEYTPVSLRDLADGRLDRIGIAGSMPMIGRKRFEARAGVWDDQDDSGGDVEIAFDFADTIIPAGRVRVATFAAEGKFSSVRGARLSIGKSLESRAIDLAYEITRDDLLGFDELNDAALQHRVRASTDWYGRNGSVLSLYVEVQLQDQEDAYLAGFHYGRSF